VIVGSGCEREGPLAAITRRVRWTEGTTHNSAADWDVGVMPLHDRLYDRGKCGYKLLEYSAAGLPSVASPVGVNADILARLGAPAPTTMAEWVDALIRTIEAPSDTRFGWGRRARHVVERDFSYTAWERSWLDAVGIDVAAA